MSFISYYSATIELLSNNKAKIEVLNGELENALQLFYDWEYVKAVDAIVSTYHKAEVPMLSAEIIANPGTLNLKSKGQWITVYIELSEGDDVGDINASSVMLNSTIPAELKPSVTIDYDNDGILDLMVKFNRSTVSQYIVSKDTMFDKVTLTITGKLKDNTPFEGSCTIKTMYNAKNTGKKWAR